MPFYFHRDVGDTSIVMYFTLHREENLSTSRWNFEVVYRPKIDGIPLFQLHPTVNRLMIGFRQLLKIPRFVIIEEYSLNLLRS